MGALGRCEARCFEDLVVVVNKLDDSFFGGKGRDSKVDSWCLRHADFAGHQKEVGGGLSEKTGAEENSECRAAAHAVIEVRHLS